MRIFVYEYACAWEDAQVRLSTKLRREGWAMLSAVLEDLRRIPGVEAVTILEEHLWSRALGRKFRSIRAERDRGAQEALIRELARDADYTLVIAPECADILWKLSAAVTEAGGRLLGSAPVAVRLAGDKLDLARHLHARGVPTPECLSLGPEQDIAGGHPRYTQGAVFPAVWKPRQGAGSQATFLVRHPGELSGCGTRARAEGWEGEMLLQPFVAGLPASVAVLVGPDRQTPLLPALQELSQDGRFHYRGGAIPLPPALVDRATLLAGRAVAAVPGLRGYVGVDLVLGEAADGSQDWVIEINPRLTTSYVGLRVLAQGNLAEAMLKAAAGVPWALAWKEGSVRFQANGRVQLSSE